MYIVVAVRGVQNNQFALNQIVTERKLNLFFPKLVQEKMTALF